MKKNSLIRKTAYIEENGCNRRLLEITKLRKYLELNDYKIVNKPKDADYIVVGTCAFKKKEEDYSISRIRALRKYDAKLLVYGCLPDIAPEKYKEFGGIMKLAPKDLDKIETVFEDTNISYEDIESSNLIDYYNFNRLIENIRQKLKTKYLLGSNSYIQQAKSNLAYLYKTFFKSSKDYYLFICKGCRGKCTYCAIRRSIGSVKSKPVHVVLNELHKGLEEGYRNIIILGDDPGCYGLDINITFPDLIFALLEECRNINKMQIRDTPNLPEIKLSINEIHPKYLILYQNELVKLLASGEIESILCPIQSGNNRILELMQREHSVEDIKRVVSKMRDVAPNLKLNTQIIVGFPSETEADFFDTLNIVKELRFDSVVVFPYHEKENTPAKKLENKVTEKVIEKRSKRALRYLGKEKIKAYSKCPL